MGGVGWDSLLTFKLGDSKTKKECFSYPFLSIRDMITFFTLVKSWSSLHDFFPVCYTERPSSPVTQRLSCVNILI